MIIDYFKIAFRTLMKRKVRSLLTILGILLAVFTIFVLLSITMGLSEVVGKEFAKLGGDKFFIQPKGQIVPGVVGAVELTTDDADIVEKVSGVKKLTYIASGTAEIGFIEKKRYTYSIGMQLEQDKIDIFKSMFPEIATGRFLKKGDSGKVVIGSRYDILFDKPIKLGNKISINGEEFDVVGIFKPIGNPPDDSQIYMSFEDFQELYKSGNRVDYIYVQTDDSKNINQVADRVKKKLMDYRNVKEETIDFTILTPEELLSTFGNVINILTVFLVGIGSISLVVGGIGIANTMYTSVLERQREIGVMKAIGARNSDILLIFIIESGLLGLAGGLLGLSFGVMAAKLIEYIANIYLGGNLFQVSMSPWILAGSLLFAFLIGILSGIIPSYQASKLKPVDALRYE